MITVLTIIVIVMAIAVPVWDALMNGTNLAAAQNEISAFISNARADAIYNRQTIGVFFFIDPKTQQTAMAEVQVQTLYQPNSPPGSTMGYTSLFTPGTWTAGNPPTWASSSTVPYTNNGYVNSIELVNNPDPNNPGSYIFYRDVVLLPKGVGVVLNNNSYTYNRYGLWGNNTSGTNPWGTNNPPVDRYVHLGCIMFAPDGTLTSIPFGVPYYEYFNQTQSTNKTPQESLICQRIEMYNYVDLGSQVNNSRGGTPAQVPLISSVGLVVYDHDAYLNQHATLQVANNSVSPPTQITIGDGSQFTDLDLNYSLTGATAAPTAGSTQAQDKFIEESWIDQNGTAYLVSPFNGSLIKAK
jgi:hypothetical protein